MSGLVETVFAVLSDFHFGNDLHEAPEVQLLNIPITYKDTTEKITRYFAAQCRGHEISCVKRLPRYLKTLLEELKDQGYQGKTFDLFVLLGDQSTLANEQSYRFLCEYLSQESYQTTDGYMTYRCSGLEIAPSQLLAIPGNHDKLLRKDLNLYHNEFTHWLNLPERLQPQRSSLSVRRFWGREFVFISIEPSIYCNEDLTLDGDTRKHLARGAVSKLLAEDVRTKLALLKQNRKLSADVRLEGSFSDAMKIMLVHYAVDLNQFDSGWAALVLPHECEDLGALVTALKEEFQLSLVLHGHLHQPLVYNQGGVQVISATTATRVDKNGKTGFFLLKVFD